jgi:putative flavoprotein involved in K+ transport
VVGAGNSAVQIAVELAACAQVTLASRHPVRFMRQRWLGRDIHFWLHHTRLDRLRWSSDQSVPVMDCGRYREALQAGRPPRRPMFDAFTESGVQWPDGSRENADDVIFATGFRTVFPFLKELTDALPHRGGASIGVPGLYFVGLSGQTGLASATLRGVGRDAARIVRRMQRSGA